MRVCPSCGELYEDVVELCSVDHTPLTSWDEALRAAPDAETIATRRLRHAAFAATWDQKALEEAAEQLAEAAQSVEASAPDVPSEPDSAPATAAAADSDDAPAGQEMWDSPTLPDASPTAGRLLRGRYALHKKMGIGGFGAVFEAEDMRLHKRVAVKVLSPRVSHNVS